MSTKGPVGYLTLTRTGRVGQEGSGYDYLTAGNGVFVECSNHLMAARVQLAHAEVRGLAPAHEALDLKAGPIPSHLFEMGLSWMMTTPGTEKMFAIRLAAHGYELEIPEQQGTTASIQYERGGEAVAEFHSHGRMRAFFSGTDDRDEVGFRIYGVCGKLDTAPEMKLRVGIYGHFGDVHWLDVFSEPGPMIRQADKEKRGI